jgi:sugar/nucleoside kinase (ribokinase family)
VADAIPATLDGSAGYDFVLIGPILGEVNLDLLAYLRENNHAPILFDPQGSLRQQVDGKIVHSLTDVFIQTARMSTIVKANELETKVVTGIEPRSDPEKAVKALHQYGAKISIVTLAEAGSIIYDGSTCTIISPYTTNAIDPTGAGDTYAGGFMVKYLETPGDLTAVGCFASSVASVMVENSGPDFPLTRAEADRRMKILLDRPQKLAL